MTLDLSPVEIQFLEVQLGRHIMHVENELVHTDSRDMQRSLARDLEALELLRRRIAKARIPGDRWS
jgi:hypothetical protein